MSSHGSQDDLIGVCQPVTLTLRLQAPRADPAAYAKRTASWTIALYAEHK